MTPPRAPRLFVSLMFLAVIFSAGLVQLAVELRRGEQPQAFGVFSRKPTAVNLREFEQRLEDESWVIKQLRPWMQRFQFVCLKDTGDKAIAGRDGWFFYKPGVQYLTARPRPNPGPDNPLPAILAFRAELAARGIQLVVVPAPNKESVYPEKLSARAGGIRGAVCEQTSELLRELTAAGVEVVDLFELYAAAKQASGSSAGAPFYLAQDSHWSPAGVDLAVKAVAQRLLERGWVKPGAIDYELKPAPVERVGDVIRMLKSPPIERAMTPEKIPCRQVVQPGNGKPYRDDPGAEILVLGDSFLRIYEQDEPGAAGFIAHLARELRQPVASIVSDGGASTLVRQELFRRSSLLANKKVVVWEFVERDIRFGAEGWQIIPLPPAPAGRSLSGLPEFTSPKTRPQPIITGLLH